MEPPFTSEVHVSPLFCNAIRSLPAPAISGKNFNLKMDILVKYIYCSIESTIEEYICSNRRAYRYKSLSWNTIDKQLSETHFPYPLERIKWDSTDKIMKNKHELIKQILEFANTVQNVKPPFQDDDTVHMSLVFVKEVYVSPQEFELTKARILTTQYRESRETLWGEIYYKIKGLLGQGSSFYEELQWLEYYIEEKVRETSYFRMHVDENYEKKLLESLIKRAKREFMSLPAVSSRMQFLHKVNLTNHDLVDVCAVCLERNLPGSEACSLPCSHNFHSDCIEMWLLKSPSCPMCRYKLPLEESK